MAVFKQVSVKVALRKIMADLGYTNSTSQDFPWQDAIEWIGEALGQIGAYTQYVPKEVDLTIDNHRAKLPCDFLHLKKVLNYGEGLVADNRNNDLIPVLTDTETEEDTRLYENAESDFDYNIIMDNIITSYKTGTLRLKYLAMPIDEEGFPMIPDNEAYKEAFFWKVARQLAIRDQLLNKQLTFDYCNRQWQWYCGQARAEAHVMTLAEKNMFAWDHNSMLPYRHFVESSARALNSFPT